jgi:hypothetical protein
LDFTVPVAVWMIPIFLLHSRLPLQQNYARKADHCNRRLDIEWFGTQWRTQPVNDILVRIKRAVLSGRYVFSDKARIEMLADGLSELDVVESILSAVAIYKVIRSASLLRRQRKESLYVIQSTNLSGLPIYTKGKFARGAEMDTYYFLISSKKAL